MTSTFIRYHLLLKIDQFIELVAEKQVVAQVSELRITAETNWSYTMIPTIEELNSDIFVRMIKKCKGQ